MLYSMMCSAKALFVFQIRTLQRLIFKQQTTELGYLRGRTCTVLTKISILLIVNTYFVLYTLKLITTRIYYWVLFT